MTDNEDDKTPRGWVSKRPGRAMTSDDRALAHRVRTSPVGVPIPEAMPDEADTTNPFDLFEPERARRLRRPSDSVMALAAKLRTDRRDFYDFMAEMAYEVTDLKRGHKSASEQLDKDFRKFIERQPGGKEFEELRSTVRLWKWIGGAILTMALGSVGIGLGALWSRAEHEGAVNTKIDRLEQDVQSLIRGEFAPRHQPKDTP